MHSWMRCRSNASRSSVASTAIRRAFFGWSSRVHACHPVKATFRNNNRQRREKAPTVQSFSLCQRLPTRTISPVANIEPQVAYSGLAHAATGTETSYHHAGFLIAIFQCDLQFGYAECVLLA